MNTTEEQSKLYILIPEMIVITFMTLLAICGNLLVIIAYLKDSKLHNVLNCYIFHLAITDFLLGITSMPFYAVYTALNWFWPFGKIFCKIYMVCDFTLCLQSVLLVIVISLDRLILVKSGIEYTLKQTMKMAKIKVTVCWILSFLLYGPAIIGFDYWRGSSVVEYGDCDVEFYTDFIFTVTTSVIEFFVPFFLIAIINILVYVEIRKRVKIRQGATKTKVTYSTNATIVGTSREGSDSDQTQTVDISIIQIKDPTNNKQEKVDDVNIQDRGISSNKKPSRTQQELKAAKSLSVLVLALAVCWTPYTVCTMIAAICEECVNKDLHEILSWLLWFKAAINPFLYAFKSEAFRGTVGKLIPQLKHCKKECKK